jgi:predicted ArsR family transcriptional regulator
MDSFDERVLSVLKDGKPRLFTQLLSEVVFSHNTLRLHLERLEAQGFVMEEKTLLNGLGRPKLAYRVPARVRQQVSIALSDPTVEIVALSFSRLKHLCRFEKGGYCKQARKNCEAVNCPQILKKKE